MKVSSERASAAYPDTGGGEVKLCRDRGGWRVQWNSGRFHRYQRGYRR